MIEFLIDKGIMVVKRMRTFFYNHLAKFKNIQLDRNTKIVIFFYHDFNNFII